MRKVFWMLGIWIAATSVCYAQGSGSPYAGQEKREIKALSTGEITAYIEGQGMGFAKAAELNEYPGPKHVLELASELKLSDKQKTDTQRVFDQMHREATRIGRLVVAKEGELDRLFASRQINSKKLQQVTGEIARLQGELRVTHLRAHLEMRALLSEAQVAKYSELRGYKSGADPNQHKGHKDGKH